MNRPYWQRADIRFYAVAASLLVSVLTFKSGGLPNNDAYTYIRTAEIFAQNGVGAAFDHYGWASYPLLIGLLHKLLGLDPFTAAYALNALLFGLLVYSYISIVREIDASPRVLLLAALTILLYPQLSEARADVVRDIGFWAFSLLGFARFLVFGRTRVATVAAGSCLAWLAAAAFRVEAIAYLFLVPLSLLFDPGLPRRQKLRLMLSCVGGGIALLLLAHLVLSAAGISLWRLVVDAFSVYMPFISQTYFPDAARSLELQRAIFGDFAATFSGEYLTLFMLFGLFPILLANLYGAIGGPYLVLLCIGWYKNVLAIPASVRTPLLLAVLTNLLILAAFLVTTRFLTSRYGMLMCLLLVVLVPLVIDRLLESSRQAGRGRLAGGLIGLLMAYCAVDSYLEFGADKSYLYEAADWIAGNSDPQVGLVTNNHAVAYFSGRVEDYDTAPFTFGAEQVLAAPRGSLIAVEEDFGLVRMLEDPAVSAQIELLVVFAGTHSHSRRLAVYRRK